MAMSKTPKTSPRVPNAAATPRRWRDLAILLGLIGLVLAGLLGLAAATGWEETIDAFGSIGFVPATLVICVTTLWFAIPIGLAVFPIAEHRSERARDALET